MPILSKIASTVSAAMTSSSSSTNTTSSSAAALAKTAARAKTGKAVVKQVLLEPADIHASSASGDNVPLAAQLEALLKHEKRFRLTANLAFFITEKEYGVKATQTTRVTSMYSLLSEIVRALCLEAYDLAVVYILLQRFYRDARAMLEASEDSDRASWVTATAGRAQTHLLAAIYTQQTILYDQPLRKAHWANLVRFKGHKDGGYTWLVDQALSFCSVIDYDFGGLKEHDLVAAHMQLIGPIENRALAAYQFVENQALQQRKAAGKAKQNMGRPTVMDIF